MVEHLPSVFEALGSVLSIEGEAGMVVYPCNVSTEG